MSHVITIRLNKELATWLDQAAAEIGVSQSQLIRDELERAKASGSTQSFMQLARSQRPFHAKGFFTEMKDLADIDFLVAFANRG